MLNPIIDSNLRTNIFIENKEKNSRKIFIFRFISFFIVIPRHPILSKMGYNPIPWSFYSFPPTYTSVAVAPTI